MATGTLIPRDLSWWLTLALQRVGASPQHIATEPLTGLGLLVTVRIRDQVTQALIPPGTVSFDALATKLVEQLHPDNDGLPVFARPITGPVGSV